MAQMPITDFFDSPDGAPLHPEEAANDFFELGALSITFFLYLYRCATTGAAVYVGQTMQTLDRRDRQHLGNVSGAPGSFDSVYTDRNMFRLEIIDQKPFEADVGSREEYRALLRLAAGWADAREIEEIARHGTYDPLGPGLNRTRGGQGDALRAVLEAKFLQSCERWANVYRPEFEAYLAEHGTLRNIPHRHPTLGFLVNGIRTGRTSVPPEHMEWMRANGFVMNHQQAVWDLDYRPAFEVHLAEHGTLRNIPRSHPTLGKLVNDIRARATSVPPEHMEWMLANGFVVNHQQAVWDLDYRPDLEVHLAEHGTLRNIPRSHPTLGSLVDNIRTGNTSVPPEHMEWMRANGFVMNHQQANWDLDYRPAFEVHLAEHGTLRNIPQSHPTLGWLVNKIRTGNTSVPPEHMEWMRANGFRWSARNVAAHVAGYLGMERINLPVEATLNEAVLHCLREAARLELFGALSVPELVGRYNEHRARL